MAAKTTVVSDTKLALELLTRLQETLNRASDKNDSLLESIETSETRAQERGGEEVSCRKGGGAASEIFTTLFFIFRLHC